MGASASVSEGKPFQSIKEMYITFLNSDESIRVVQLQRDLATRVDVRLAFANYIWIHGCKSLVIREMVLNVNESFLSSLMLHEQWEYDRDYNSDIILFYFSKFASSIEYEPYFTSSSTCLQTPSISRCSSFADVLELEEHL